MAFTESRTPNLAKLLVCKLQDFFFCSISSVLGLQVHTVEPDFLHGPQGSFYHVSNYKAIKVTDLCKFTLAYLSTFFLSAGGMRILFNEGRTS